MLVGPPDNYPTCPCVKTALPVNINIYKTTDLKDKSYDAKSITLM